MPILGTVASQFSGKPSSSYESIATVTVGSGGSATVTFSSIPATYTHLQIRCIAYTPDSSNIHMRFNSDTASNYSTHQLSGNGSATESYGSASANIIAIGKANYSGANSSMFAPGVYDILDYKNTNKYKTARSFTGVESNGTAGQQVALLSGSWRNTASITSISLFPTSGNFTQYTQFALYGIKGA